MVYMGRFILGVALLISVVQVTSDGEEALPLLVLSLLVTGLALCLPSGRRDDAGK
ncbi:hypothetical protein GCM10023146_32670 [Nocardioides caricicola]